MSYKTTTLGNAAISASSYSYLLPAMQRPYVWETSDAIKLFESIYKGFPIGTALLWETKATGNLDLGANRVYKIPSNKTCNNELFDYNIYDGDNITLVLDGQQRLTTINIALNGYWETKKRESLKMYFDMDKTPDDKEPFKIAESVTGVNFIPCRDIMRWRTKELFDDYIYHKGITNTGWLSNLAMLYECFWSDEAFCYGVCKARDMAEAVEIFIASNSSGKTLDQTDLIMAYLSTSWNTIDAKVEVKDLVTELNQKFYKSNPFSTKSVLKTFLCISYGLDGKLLTSSMSGLLKSLKADLIDELEKQWGAYRKAIVDTCTLIDRWGIAKSGLLKSTNAIIPIILWLMKNKIDITSETTDVVNSLELARRWLLISVVNGVFSGQTDLAITATRKSIMESGLVFPLRELMKDSNLHGKHNLTNTPSIHDFISGLGYSKDNVQISLLLYLVRGSFPKGIERDTKYDLDHIFSKTEYNNFEAVHSIGNIQLMPSGDNKRKGNMGASVLWKSNRYGEEFLRMNVLPVDSTDVDNPHENIYNLPEKLVSNRISDLAVFINSLVNLY
ncbi:DUF262 domain-containing protein [Photobacterium damselae]